MNHQSSSMHEREFLQTIRERLCPDVIAYIKEYLPITHPTYYKLCTMKKTLRQLKHQEKQLRWTIIDQLDNCFDPAILRHLSSLENKHRHLCRQISYMRNSIIDLNTVFLRSQKRAKFNTQSVLAS